MYPRACLRCGAIYANRLETCGQDGAALLAAGDALVGRTFGDYVILEVVELRDRSARCRARHAQRGWEFALEIGYADRAAASDVEEARRLHDALLAPHANLARLFDVGSVTPASFFAVSEVVSGRTLEQTIHEDGPFTPFRAARIAHHVAKGLFAMHERGATHGSLRSCDVVIVEEVFVEVARIADFRLFHRPGAVSSRRVADLHSLGALIHEMLTGHEAPALPGVATPTPSLEGPSAGVGRLALALMYLRPGDRLEAASVLSELDILSGHPAFPRPERSTSPLAASPTGDVTAPLSSSDLPTVDMAGATGPDLPFIEITALPTPTVIERDRVADDSATDAETIDLPRMEEEAPVIPRQRRESSA